MNSPRLAQRLREATAAMHRVAERSNFMREMLKARVEKAVYCIFLRNLHALYTALESELEHHAGSPDLAPLRMPTLFRTDALARDLVTLSGPDWAALPLAAAMASYVERIHQLAASRPALLTAHAYIRYMGDLSGGQLVGDVVRRALSLRDDAGAAFYHFDGDAAIMKEQFRAALDELPVDADTADAILVEANAAFGLHVRLFEELDAASAGAH
jgi:heme oxygenase